MLQVALGGSYTIDDKLTTYINDPVYYEPGFNIISPLELSVDVADRIYILIRRRLDTTATFFDNINISNLEATVKDASNGEDVTAAIVVNDIHSEWNNDSDPSGIIPPLVLNITNAISLTGSTLRVRVIDCSIKDTVDNDFIVFRIIIDDENRYFHYIPIEMNNIVDRNSYTISGRQAYVTLNSATDFYVLFSPYAYLVEGTKNNSDFSYPLNTIFYRRQKTFNDENYNFSINSYSHTFLPDMISVMNVPNYGKSAVILIDNMLYTSLVEAGENGYVNINVNGELSGVSDIFRVNFYRG